MSPRRRRRWYWLRIPVLMVVIYGGVALWAQSIADSMIFLPNYGSRVEPVGATRIGMSDGTWVSAVYLPNPAARFVLWYFHGNAEALGDLAPRLMMLRDQGFSVFAVEYPGYGVSGGTPSEKSIAAANRAALAYLDAQLQVPPQRLVLYGRSVGGGPAVDVAAREPVAGLILESAFVSAFRVMTRWPLLPGDRFKNLQKMKRVRCPVLVMHGRLDRVIPFWHGEALHAAVRGLRQCLWVADAGHNDLREAAGPAYDAALQEFRSSLPLPQP